MHEGMRYLSNNRTLKKRGDHERKALWSRGGVSWTPVFCPVFSLRDCVHLFFLSVVWFVLSQPFGQSRKVKPESSTCVIASCCLVCSGLHACYTDVFNGSSRFPSRHVHTWYSVPVHVPGIQMVVVVTALDTTRPGEVLCFICNNSESMLNSARTPSIESGHRSQGYIAQW